MAHAITGLPGYRSDRNATYRRIRKTDMGAIYMPGGVTIDGANSGDAGNTGNTDVLRPGKIMVQAASGGLYRPLIIGLTTAAYADNDLTITVSAATATEVARLRTVAGGNITLSLIGAATDAAAGAIVATDFSCTGASGTTLVCADLNVTKVTGALIALATTTLAYVPGTACFVDDGTGIKCSDEDGTRINQPFPNALVGGYIDESQIIDFPSSANVTLRTYVRGLLNAANTGYGFRFDGAEVGS